MSRAPKFKFRLYVAGDAQNSALAIANLTAFCKQYLADQSAVEIVNVFQEPDRALEDKIFMTPTLMKLAPAPAPQKIVGTLSQPEPILLTLGIKKA